MMHRRLSHAMCLPVIMLLSLVACSGAPSAAPQGQSGALDRDSAIIVALQGQASVKRSGWSEYAPAVFGMSVRKGDLMRLGATAQAQLACADLKLAALTGGVNGMPCKTGTPAGGIVYSGGLVNPTRGGLADDYPQIVLPRKTKLLNPRPLLRWTAIPSASSYTLSIQGTSWTTEITGKTEVPYPAGAPSLEVGKSYLLVVSAGSHASTEEAAAGLGFSVMQPDEATSVRDAEARIRGLRLEDTPTRLLIANLYASHGLNAEAVVMLEGAAGSEPAVSRLLGDLHIAMGLNEAAEKPYADALALSTAANDVEGQGIAHHRLGQIAEALGDSSRATEELQQAIPHFEKLGDAATLAQIRAGADRHREPLTHSTWSSPLAAQFLVPFDLPPGSPVRSAVGMRSGSTGRCSAGKPTACNCHPTLPDHRGGAQGPGRRHYCRRRRLLREGGPERRI